MLEHISILYIEDDRLSREIVERLVRKSLKIGHLHVMDMTENYLDRVKALHPRPQVILLDIHMHPYSGFDVLRQLRAEPGFASARIVALTASVTNRDLQVLREHGFDAAIAKPVRITTFPQLLQRIINGENIWTVV